MPTPYTHIVQDLAGQLFQVRDTGTADLAHVFHGMAVKRVGGGFAPKKGAREILVRKLGCRVVADLVAKAA
ncbi:hypothetical protein [Methylorubrum sp. DB1722]|uniref:hypothetical protein n=1 Tax=Methylorubrum sp. DB1722 TaxID=2478916 RepID=UPI0018E39991|nr:hypothetical protein [Methylorubrum sp. DB1722]MBI1690499.1 hypothetical protein [Methylorubrum sp. DB1722]